MKKNLLNLILLIGVSFDTYCQTIPNGSFENWANDTLNRLDIAGWETTNLQYTNVSVLRTAGHTGSYSAKMSTVYDFGSSMYKGGIASLFNEPWTSSSRPTTLTGYFKQLITGSILDGFHAHIYLFDASLGQVGAGGYNASFSTNYPNWTAFTAPITYTSNNPIATYNLVVSYTCGPSNFTGWAMVDDLTLDVSTGLNELEEPYFSISPNPSSGKFILSNTTGLTNNNSISVFNILGKTVYREENISFRNNFVIDISSEPKGIYFIYLQSGVTAYKKKIILE